MNWLKFAIIAYVTVILQTSLVPVVVPGPFRPNLLVVLAAFYVLTVSDHRAMVAALILGLLGDMTSLSPLGSQIVAFGMIAMAVRTARPILFTDLPMTHGFAAAVGYLILVLVYRALTIIGLVDVPMGAGFAQMITQAAATGLLGAILCKLAVRRLKPRWSGPV